MKGVIKGMWEKKDSLEIIYSDLSDIYKVINGTRSASKIIFNKTDAMWDSSMKIQVSFYGKKTKNK